MADSYTTWLAITPSDTADLPALTQAIYVGGAGTLAAVMANGTAGTFTGVLAGQILPLTARRVNATNTTATNLVSLRV
jgi:hypothetical protein